MSEGISNNHAPIFTFLNKHKWRIILPMIFALFYFAIPRYLAETVAVQQNLFVKSSILDQQALRNEIDKIEQTVLSDGYLLSLATKYDLFVDERNEVEKLRKMRIAITVRQDGEELIDGSEIFIWVYFRKELSAKIVGISNELRTEFERIDGLHMDKYVSNPYNANPWRNWVFFGALMQGFVMLVIPLILLWEIPNLFYSTKTKETVFDPIKSDWQNELYDAKLRNQTWKAFEINFRYSTAFILAMLQKTPVGDLIEYVRKIAS
jgi:hypothetical protein